jgi:hypothetical protein
MLRVAGETWPVVFGAQGRGGGGARWGDRQ